MENFVTEACKFEVLLSVSDEPSKNKFVPWSFNEFNNPPVEPIGAS